MEKKITFLHPLILLLLFFATTMPASFASYTINNSASISVLTIIIINSIYIFLWPFCVAQYSSIMLGNIKSMKRNKMLVLVVLLCFVYIFSLGPRILFTELSALDIAVDIIGAIVMIFVYFAYASINWTAAKNLLELEGKQEVNNSKIFGTFVLFLLWPFGAIFLHKRIKETL